MSGEGRGVKLLNGYGSLRGLDGCAQGRQGDGHVRLTGGIASAACWWLEDAEHPAVISLYGRAILASLAPTVKVVFPGSIIPTVYVLAYTTGYTCHISDLRRTDDAGSFSQNTAPCFD